jgi:hypothetical protein
MNTLLQPFLLTEETWYEVKDGDHTARSIFRRHYSNRHIGASDPALFVGPGEKVVLLTPCARAMFVWRRFKSDDGQQGINCAVFRNEGAGLSSTLIVAADEWAWRYWTDEPRHYTYVNERRIRSTNPGACFKKAGWKRCGTTKRNRLAILERIGAATAC